jgi:ubiquinone/menaquinone biosynthesis C-methylase UbiE/uncharacterized protein YbaR (Trm112 family)
MNLKTLSFLRCPICKGQLSNVDFSNIVEDLLLEGSLACLSCGKVFPVKNGIVSFASKSEVDLFEQGYANMYQNKIEQQFNSFANTQEFWAKFSEKFSDQKIKNILDVACGPGSSMIEWINGFTTDKSEDWTIVGADLSYPMLVKCNENYHSFTDHLLLVHADCGGECFLPFDDCTFDFVQTIGAINQFPNIRAALFELTRVVKVGGKVFIMDEGLAPWLLETEFGSQVLKVGTNDLGPLSSIFAYQPPLAHLPITATDVVLQWMPPSNAFWVLLFTKGSGASLNLDTEFSNTHSLREAFRDASDLIVRVVNEYDQPLENITMDIRPYGWAHVMGHMADKKERTNKEGIVKYDGLLASTYCVRIYDSNSDKILKIYGPFSHPAEGPRKIVVWSAS